MPTSTRRKLSIAFSVYNKARAQALRSGDNHQVELCNQVLGRMVRQAFR